MSPEPENPYYEPRLEPSRFLKKKLVNWQSRLFTFYDKLSIGKTAAIAVKDGELN